MARLLPGENSKIDMINEHVRLVQQGGRDESNDSLIELLELFRPLMLKLCKKWSDYFDNSGHLINFNDAIDDCTYWFYHYTKNVYIIDGRATYNKFIKDHLDQRIRYIYECEIKCQKKLLFPDPYTNDVNGGGDVFDDVVNKYAFERGRQPDLSDSIIDCEHVASKSKLYKRIMKMIQCKTYNDRERDIFVSVIIDQKTHEQLGDKYGISRTRVTQILDKMKHKLYKQMEEEEDEIWELLDNAGINITNPKLMK